MTPFPARPPSPCSDAMPASKCAKWRPCSPTRPSAAGGSYARFAPRSTSGPVTRHSFSPARPMGALRAPAAHGIAAEQARVLVPPHDELQPDALVAGEQREITVRRRRADDLEPARVLEAAERRHQVVVE